MRRLSGTVVIPGRSSLRILPAAERSTLRATYANPGEPLASPLRTSPSLACRTGASCLAGRSGSSTWYGVATTSTASSETASSLPLRSRIDPRRPGTGTVSVCWLWASADSPAPWIPCTHAARATARHRRTRKLANRSPIRRSTIGRLGGRVGARDGCEPRVGGGRGLRGERRIGEDRRAGRHLAGLESLGGGGRVLRACLQVSDRTRLGHDHAELARLGLDVLVRHPGLRDLSTKRRDLAVENVGLASRLAGRGVEAEGDHVQRDDSDQEALEDADPEPAACEAVNEAGLGETRDRPRRATDGDRHEPGRHRGAGVGARGARPPGRRRLRAPSGGAPGRRTA